MYSPTLGRFLQRDVYQSGVPAVTEKSFHGRATDVPAAHFLPRDRYADGMNIYQYVGSNPVMRRDPLGLFFTTIDLAVSSGMEAELRARDAARGTLAMAFLIAMLGSTVQDGQWGAGGGISGTGFDVFLEGADRLMRADPIAELMFAGAYASVLAKSLGDRINKAISFLPVIADHVITQSGKGWTFPES
jgi:hypothetical protein